MIHSRTLSRLALALALLPLAACAMHRPALRLEGDDERAAVLAVVERTFDAIAAKGEESEALWREVLLDAGSLSSVRVREDGTRGVMTLRFADHFARFAQGEEDPRPYLERLWDPVVLIDGDIALVWGRYDFWLDEQFSHGGTDVITLLRTDAGWKIAALAWTHEPEARESPLGDPLFGE